ncbi:MAG: hypothetical protein C4576_35415 [Desulfobacteraceae bacterium]|nr:MAG: hypothetical protein C4576_35415 [Desulfobacteraceae bacterium]
MDVVVVGAGNVGLQAILNLGLVCRGTGAPWKVFVVDFDRIETKDVSKGYHPSLIGRFKAEGAVLMVGRLFGEETERIFHPVIAAAQSVPGLISQGDAVFNGTDSSLDAAFVSEEARNIWEFRLTTGIFGQIPFHTLEVLPPGLTLADASYDNAAWADAARHECGFGTPWNSSAGVSQPFGTLTAALAVQCMLCRSQEKESSYSLIRVQGDQLFQVRASREPISWTSGKIDLTYDSCFGRLWSEAAVLLGASVEDVRFRFPVPIVTRRCGDPIHGLYRGFERQPVRGLCPVCGMKTLCLDSPCELSLEEVSDLAYRKLREINAPAGMRFLAWTKDGRRKMFHLPYREEDIPSLEESRNSKVQCPTFNIQCSMKTKTNVQRPTLNVRRPMRTGTNVQGPTSNEDKDERPTPNVQ